MSEGKNVMQPLKPEKDNPYAISPYNNVLILDDI